MLQSTIQPSMTVCEAGLIWLETRRPYIQDRTAADYLNNVRTLSKFFASVRLDQITADFIREFQLFRRQRVSAGNVNQETNVLRQILKRARLWERIDNDYQRLPMSMEKRGRALTEEEEYRLFAIGKLNPNWEVTYNVALLSAHTAAGPGEIKHLRLKDVFLGNGDPQAAWMRIREEGAKNQYRLRTIPLDREAFQAVEALLRIAKERGAYLEDHYLLPKRNRGHRGGGSVYDPTRCITTFKTAWTEMLAAADIQNFRMYDLRHHALTRLAEKNPEQVVLKIAGHVSSQMLRKVYAHVRDNAVRDAIDTLSRPDGWKPSQKTLQLLQPKRFSRDQIPALKKRAEEVKKEAVSEDSNWLWLVKEEEEE